VTEEPAPFPAIRPRWFQRENLDAVGEEELRGLVSILDLQDQLPAVARLRDWAMAALHPAPGAVCLDVGAGTGSEVVRLASAVSPGGRAVGVEPNPGMRAEAERRARSRGSAAEFVDGDAAALPFGDREVDLVRCERVFQHLADPSAAAREIARVLRPGGRVVVLDSDWGTAVTYPGDADVVRRYTIAFWARMANPFAGRHLRAQLQGAGLRVDPDVGSAALVMPDQALASGGILRLNADLTVEEGGITRAEADRLVGDVAAAASRGEAFVSVTMFAVLARKPD
jgi:ubiquinone/menaquinone biosynthesis C-methylase UbiE